MSMQKKILPLVSAGFLLTVRLFPVNFLHTNSCPHLAKVKVKIEVCKKEPSHCFLPSYYLIPAANVMLFCQPHIKKRDFFLLPRLRRVNFKMSHPAESTEKLPAQNIIEPKTPLSV
jgi:hypothetical protein